MGTMLIVKAVLLLGVVSESKNLAVSSAPTSENPVSSTTSKSKRDFTTSSSVNWSTEPSHYQEKKYNVPYSSSTSTPRASSQAETTVRTSKGHSTSPSVTFSPYQYYEGKSQSPRGPSHSGQSVQTTSSSPVLQGGFQASQDPRQRSSTSGFKKTSTPYDPQSSKRVQTNVAPVSNVDSQYFANPSSYRLYPEPSKASAQGKSGAFSSSGDAQHFPKFKSLPASRPNRQSPTEFGSFDSLPKFRFSPSTTFEIQAEPLVGSGQRSKSAAYRSNSYPNPKNLDVSPTAFASELPSASNFKSFNKLVDNYQYGGSPTVAYASKQLSIPDSLQFDNSPRVSGFKSFDNEALLLSTGLDYQAQPSSGLRFEFPKSSPTSLPSSPASFTTGIGNYQARILPVHSSSSTAQLPQYKAASINAFDDYGKSADGGYQLLANQPQLHFTKTIPLQPADRHQSVVYHSNRPFEKIRSDVEVINNKRVQIPTTDGSYEHNFDGGFKIKDVGHFAADEVDVSAPVKSPVRDVSFELPSSNLFNSYDEAFGKYSKLASLEHDNVKVKTKPVYQSVEIDDDKIDKSGEYLSSYSDIQIPSSFEHEHEVESRRSERVEARDDKKQKNEKDDSADEDDDDVGSEAFRSYGVDFEKDFEESYRKELPKTEYVHVKEVPDIEEPSSDSKKRRTNRNSPKTVRSGTKEKSRHVVQSEYEEPKEYESYTSQKYELPKTTFRDSEGHSTKTSYTKSKSSEPGSDESYSYNAPRDRGTTRYTKNVDSESDEGEQHRLSRQSLNPTLSPIDVIKSYTFPPFSSAKGARLPSSKSGSRASDSHGSSTVGAKGLSNNDEQRYRLSQVNREGIRQLVNGQGVRDLTGI